MRKIEASPLVIASGKLWPQATEAEFLSAIEDGTLPEAAFGRWLVQDYLFAQGLTSFQAIAAARAPRRSQKILIAGLTALDNEMEWFESTAAKQDIDLEAAPHPICRRYCDFLIASAYSKPFSVLLAILYAVEASYLVAWSALHRTGPYAEFIERWSNDQFVTYVRGLLELCAQHFHPDQQEHFNEVLHHERDFWRMTWEA